MTINDPISDMLTRVRNAITAGQSQVAMPSSKIKAEIARILKDEGFLESFDVIDDEKTALILELGQDGIADAGEHVGNRIVDSHELISTAYQDDFTTPGTLPCRASSRKQMRHSPNRRI